jgi:hypothetical protein
MSNDKDLIDKLLGYPEIDVCADAADEIVGLRSACARLRTDKEKLRADHKTYAEGAAKVMIERDKYWRQAKVMSELLEQMYKYLDDEDWAMRNKIEAVLKDK